ncbi:hypothetical protein K2173_010539 [Erythroxylum novogranatense]|uniref:Uncharacterized protein n=1 Tax=Erythroxylum novogranatense TaxID=1862640 RepID=A0AAV8TE65_9ROSI|nr:hypothetical protein K2173_010539 [Erythroxylum novogranatense]
MPFTDPLALRWAKNLKWVLSGCRLVSAPFKSHCKSFHFQSSDLLSTFRMSINLLLMVLEMSVCGITSGGDLLGAE